MHTDEEVRAVLLASPTRYRDAEGNWLPADEVVRLLTTPEEVPNPKPQGTALPRLTKSGLAAVVGDDAIATLSDVSISELSRAVEAQDRETIALWGRIGFQRGKLTQEQYDVIAAALAATVPDPTWTATVTISPEIKVTGTTQVSRVLEGL